MVGWVVYVTATLEVELEGEASMELGRRGGCDGTVRVNGGAVGWYAVAVLGVLEVERIE